MGLQRRFRLEISLCNDKVEFPGVGCELVRYMGAALGESFKM